MDKHDDVDGLRRFLKRRYALPGYLPDNRITLSDALGKLGSAIYGDAWLGHEIQLVEPDRDACLFVKEAWHRRLKTLQIMAELLETEITQAFAYDQDDEFVSLLDPSIWRKQNGQIALDNGEIEPTDGRRRIWPIILLIEQESFETALASLPLSRALTYQGTETEAHHEGRLSLPRQPTYSEALKYIEQQYVEEGFNDLRERLIDALMSKTLVALGHRRHRLVNAGGRRLVLSKGLVPVDPLVWVQSAPQGIVQFLQDPAGDLNEGWLYVSLVRPEVMDWLRSEAVETPHLRRFERVANQRLGKQNALDAEKECRLWLKDKMSRDGKLREKARNKTDYRLDAVEQFGVSIRQFNRAWDNAIEETGAERWREAGRPTKSR